MKTSTDRTAFPAAVSSILLLGLILLGFTLPARADDSNHLLAIANGEVVGTLDAIRTGNRVDVAYAVDDNGRGPKIQETVELDQNGFPLSWKISGSSLFGADVDEAYRWSGGKAKWHSQADKGSVKSPQPMMYIGGDSSPWALGMYVRALLDAPGHTLAVLPSGKMRLETLDNLEVGNDKTPVTVYQVLGIQLQPQLVALDASRRLFASLGGRGALVRKGYEASVPRLQEWARDYQQRRLEQLQDKLAHSYSAPIRYRNVRVFDSRAKTLGQPVSVLVKDGRIAAIGPAEAGDAATEVLVDGAGGALVPGLYDMHSHSSMTSGLFYLAVGVTSTRDMGNDNKLLAEIRSGIRDGKLAGPRISPDGLIEARSPYSVRIGIVTDSEAGALEAVRWYAARGYKEIKIYNSMQPEWVAPIIEEAHEHGLSVTGHVPAFMSPDEVIRDGYKAIAHINQLMLGWLLQPGEDTRTTLRLTAMKRAAHLDLNSPPVQKTIELMREHGTALGTTSVILERLMLSRAGEVPPGDGAYLSHMPIGYQRYRKRTFVPLNEPGDDAAYRAAFGTLLRVMKLLYDRQVRLLVGTDDTSGFTVERELELYVNAGIPAADTLTMATMGAAGYLGQTWDLGSIEVGKYADFLLVPGNPVKDISAIRQVRLTSRGGVIYYPQEIYQALGIEPFAAPPEVRAPGGAR